MNAVSTFEHHYIIYVTPTFFGFCDKIRQNSTFALCFICPILNNKLIITSSSSSSRRTNCETAMSSLEAQIQRGNDAKELKTTQLKLVEEQVFLFPCYSQLYYTSWHTWWWSFLTLFSKQESLSTLKFRGLFLTRKLPKFHLMLW